MAEGATLLVDHVLPAVGYRQGVLSFEGPLAVRLGYDRALLAKVAEKLARAVMHDMRWSAKERHALAAVDSRHAGVFMVVQRFRSDLGLFVHLHALITDGAFEERGGEVRFMPAATPTPERLTAVLAQVHKAVAAVAEGDDLDPALAACVQLGLSGPHLAPPQEPATRPPLTVIGFLARLIRPRAAPHFHTTKYFGVFANRHHLRARILPPSQVPAPGQQLDLDLVDTGAANDGAAASPRRLGWANLLARVFAVDVTVCRKCGGRMRILDIVRDPDDIARILHDARAPGR